MDPEPEPAAATDVVVPDIDTGLARRLVVDQFPQWARLPVRAVAVQGNDNRTFRLGDELSIRLPSAPGYERQVLKEHRWLPYLKPFLSLPVPDPIAIGRPGCGYPLTWSVYRWIAGDPVSTAPAIDRIRLAEDLAAFLAGLRTVPAVNGPPAGAHSAFRGTPLAHHADETLAAIRTLPSEQAGRAAAVFDRAVSAGWSGPPVWFHCDVAVDNLLVKMGRLAAVIDFGCCGVGDPACDLVPAWTMFSGRSREVFRGGVDLDEQTWARGRGWALWKALITLTDLSPVIRVSAHRTLGAVLESDLDR